MKISILVSTYGVGIYRMPMLILPMRADVEYVIVHQSVGNDVFNISEEETLKDLLNRPDVKYVHQNCKGITKSRNLALQKATGDILVIADDDVTYKNEYFELIKSKFQENHDLDIALFQIKTSDVEIPFKDYGINEFVIRNSLYPIASIEICISRKAYEAGRLYFDERFGVGSKKIIGSEETVFLHLAVEQKLKIKYFPYPIVEHPFETTTRRIQINKYDNRLIFVTGAVDAIKSKWVSIPKAFFGTLKLVGDLVKNKKNPLVYWIVRTHASLYILLTNRKSENGRHF